ncbi:hypothetical protein BDP27DRAFT_1384505 [Rhodocollybia butyracea]|uniref:Uncharacterized protein n=1 Tax=Rhodocollybia butyracea TaxID=206335 RepID=A0A9P5PP99_9AGAR|nr:hypothetical protein BDP27DRAFT_1384505 [Rhodocollybia butyracea]
MEAALKKVDQTERGKGMQNFKYAPAFDEFVAILYSHSPHTHTWLSQHFPARTHRSLRTQQSHAPKLPVEICEATFTWAKQYLESLNISDPVAIACDDTKLFSSLGFAISLFGAIDGPREILDIKNVREYMNDSNITKGTKVTNTLLYNPIPLPGFAPIIIAALPITDSCGADALLGPHKQIIFSLLQVGIALASYFCDGTETERKIQHIFEAT